jgi:DNA polymerase (family 10)
MPMTNVQIAAVFDEIADLLEFQGANPFRLRAYRNGARVIHDLPEPAETIYRSDDRQLTDLDGIGKDLADKIVTLIKTGDLPLRQELLKEIPASVLALLRIPGLGPKKAAVLFHELKITTLDELREACQQQRVRALKGFGAKTEETILSGLDIAEQSQHRIYWAEADELVQHLRHHFKSCEVIQQLEFAGSYRRGRDTVGDLDILVVSDQAEVVMDHFATFSMLDNILARGETKMSIRLTSGFQVDLRVVPAESFGAALQYFTGSKDHNVVIRSLARKQGLKVNEYGVYRGDEAIAGRTETEVYDALGLPCFPPEMREARREFDWAAQGELPRLIELADLQGDLHMHTTETDGKASLQQMCAAAKQRGLKYIAITDHSKRVSMANGLNADRLRRQWDEIQQLNEHFKSFTVLKGIECDILEGGGLDLEDDVLAEADWVVCSVHYGQNQPRDQITRRIVGAIENPHVSAIAHPTGRLLNRRNPYDVDLEAVFEAARDHGKLLELNANPARLDLNDVACAAAKSYGIKIVISSDAHGTQGLDVLRYGVLQARRAGLTKDDVANTRTWKQMQRLIGRTG